MRAIAPIVMLAVGACTSFGTGDGASSSGASSSGASSSGASSGAPPPTEDCFDGRDDDGNGKADCEEPSCTPYARCTAAVSAYPGWSGFATIVPSGASCPPELPVGEDVWATDDAVATCSACTCTGQISCSSITSVTLSESAFAGCSQGLNTFQATSGCGSIPSVAGGVTAQYWSATAPGVSSCVASAGTPTPPASKHRAARACANGRLGGGCPAGQVCASVPSTGLCITRPSQGAPVACPPAFPVLRMTAPKTSDPETAFKDNRTCSPCGCGKPTGGACPVTVSLFSDGNCGTMKGSVPANGLCTQVSCGGACNSSKLAIGNPTQPTCGAATGGQPIGTVEVTGTGTQYCCDR